MKTTLRAFRNICRLIIKSRYKYDSYNFQYIALNFERYSSFDPASTALRRQFDRTVKTEEILCIMEEDKNGRMES